MESQKSNCMKKLFVFSNLRAKEFIEDVLAKDAKQKNLSQSAVIEELLLKGIGLSHPELLSEVREIYRHNLDAFLLGEDENPSSSQEVSL